MTILLSGHFAIPFLGQSSAVTMAQVLVQGLALAGILLWRTSCAKGLAEVGQAHARVGQERVTFESMHAKGLMLALNLEQLQQHQPPLRKVPVWENLHAKTFLSCSPILH